MKPPNKTTILSAALLVFSFPPWSFSFLTWFALIPWFFSLKKVNSYKSALIEGIWLSFFMSLGCFYWVAYALREYGNVPLPLNVLGLLLFSTFNQPQFPMFALLFYRFNKKTPSTLIQKYALIFLFSFVYVGLDSFLPKLFLDTLGHALYLSSLQRQAADLGGVGLLTFIIFLINFSLFLILLEKPFWSKKNALAMLPALLFLSLNTTYGYFRNEQIQKILKENKEHVQIGVIQANIGDFDKVAAESGVTGAAEKVLNAYYQLSYQALKLTPKPDVLVWPETSYPSTFRNPETLTEKNRDLALTDFVREQNIPLLFGGYDTFKGKDYNSFFILSPFTKESDLQIYHKSILLLFGEYIPGADWISFLKTSFPQVGNFGRGQGPKVYSVKLNPREIKISPIICYEALFPSFILDAVRMGSQVILNVTNDSWFGPEGEPYMHLALSAFRSIESRTPQVRSTNTGVSALILPDGSIQHPSSLNKEEILNLKVPILPPLFTLMLAWGDWFKYFSLLVGLCLIFKSFSKKPSQLDN